MNVNNNCSTGSTALFLAAQAVRFGQYECAMALGFEKMRSGPDHRWRQRGLGVLPLGRHIGALTKHEEFAYPVAPWMFGVAAREHMKEHGSTPEHFAKIGQKNHAHSVQQPLRAVPGRLHPRRHPGCEDGLRPLTRLQCSPTSDGSARRARQRGVRREARPGRAGGRDRRPGHDNRLRLLLRRSAKNLVGYDMTSRPPARSTSRRVSGPRTSRSSSCTTASPPTSC